MWIGIGIWGEHLHRGVDNLKRALDRDLDGDLEQVWGTSGFRQGCGLCLAWG